MSPSPRSGGRFVAIAAAGLLAVGVGVLAVMALQQGRGAGEGGMATPAPTFTFGDLATGAPSDPAATADASASPNPAPGAGAAADERFLAVDGSDVWRATAGACASGDAPGVAPVVEYSTNGGRTWVDVTPADAVRVLNVAILGAGQGEVVAATGAECAPTVLRTYTAGRAWEAFPQALAGATFVSPADRASVVAAGATVAAPCGDARSARTSRDRTGVVCDGTAYVRDGDAWTAVTGVAAAAPASTGAAVALDAVAGTIVVAHVSEECAGGVAVTRFAGSDADAGTEDLGCFSDVDASTPAALSVLDSTVMLWSGDAVRVLD